MTALSVSGKLGKQDCTKYNESVCTCTCVHVRVCYLLRALDARAELHKNLV